MELLRFTTAGSVDDGKSTLIGRLLFDTKSINIDQLSAIETSSKNRGLDSIDLSLLTDGLKSEREQGITIDVAYRYFSTSHRKFIIADTPGHVQYTRNMITGASTANLALILVDARKGILEQTKRHAFIASLLGISHIILCVNKMDLVDYSEEVFNKIVYDFKDFSQKLNVNDIQYIPISALNGDNVVHRSSNMSWYEGSTLLYLLENVHISSDQNQIDSRFCVQTVIRPRTAEHPDYRGYAGKTMSGTLRKGDKIIVLPSGMTSEIIAIENYKNELLEASAPLSVVIRLKDDLDIDRGDMISRINNQPKVSQDLDLVLCWLSNSPYQPEKTYIIKHTSNETRAVIKNILYKIDINSLSRIKNDKILNANSISRVKIRTMKQICFDSYTKNRAIGSVILIDEDTNETVGAGIIL